MYTILMAREFYGNVTRRQLLEDDNGRLLTFFTRSAAKNFLIEYEAGRYYLADNEICRPTYTIRRAQRAQLAS